MSAFEELGVMPEIIQALEDMDWVLPTPVQTETVPLILGGGDVAAAAETGSGKTGAFCIPILQTVFETRRTNIAPLPAATNGESPDAAFALSPEDRGRQVAVDLDTCAAQCRHPSIWQGVRANRGVGRGKWYFAARADDDGLLRIGWSTRDAALNLGTDGRGFGFGGTGMKSHRGKFDRFGCAYTKGDIVYAAVEFSVNGSKRVVRVSYAVNDEYKGVAFEVPAVQQFPCLLPAIAMKNAQVTVDFSKHVEALDELGFKPIAQATPEDAKPEIIVDAADDEGCTMDDVDSDRKPLALILEPARELAAQVEQELTKFGKYLEEDSVRHLLLVGGGSPKEEIRRLKEGVDIVSGTLGTIQSHLQKKRLSLEHVRFLVLDEADTFASDNLRDVLAIHQAIPTRNQVQTLLFSATLHSPEIKNLAEQIQRFPVWIDLKGKEAVPETVHHTLVRVDANADLSLLDQFPENFHWPLDSVHKPSAGSECKDAADIRSHNIKKLKLAALKKVIDANNMTHAMLFVRTQLDADNLESFLLQCSGVKVFDVGAKRFKGRRESGPELEYSCACLHGGRRQNERSAALAAFKASEVRFLICTDVAARGIDVKGLPFLVNMTLPDKSENYIHRVGRVGRAERYGLAVSIVAAQNETVWFHVCNRAKNGVCNRRKLVSAGGCLLVYSESKLLAEIEARLKNRIQELGENFQRITDGPPILYGSRKGEATFNEQTAANVNAIKPALQELVSLELKAQASFFALQAKYATT